MRQQFRVIFWALSCAFLLLAGGCSSRMGSGGSGEPHSFFSSDSARPLTGTEKEILHSTGQIDRHVPASAMADVEREYTHYLRRGRPTIERVSKRAEKFLAYSRKVFRDRGMPEELAYLAIVESGCRPDVKSGAGAAGLWQFMPHTGRKYGLDQDWWLDERLDPYESTEAAAAYLRHLHGYFDDWPTAIAAYNAGEGKMRRAREGTGGRNFFEIKARNHVLSGKEQLREETERYVPRFLAVTKIMRNLSRLGFDPIEPERVPTETRLSARPGTDLKALSSAASLRWEDFQARNLHYKRTVTPTDRSSFVYVPAHREREAAAFLQSEKSRAYAGWRPVRVASSRETWEDVSRRANVPISRLRAANPDVSGLSRGMVVLLPASAGAGPPAADSRNVLRAVKEKHAASHMLKADETLYSVAVRYKVSLKDLQDFNQIDDPRKVHAGKLLHIPAKNVAGKVSPIPPVAGMQGRSARRIVHTVQERDNLWNIARKYNVSVADLKRWNNIGGDNLRAGIRLEVRRE